MGLHRQAKEKENEELEELEEKEVEEMHRIEVLLRVLASEFEGFHKRTEVSYSRVSTDKPSANGKKKSRGKKTVDGKRPSETSQSRTSEKLQSANKNSNCQVTRTAVPNE